MNPTDSNQFNNNQTPINQDNQSGNQPDNTAKYQLLPLSGVIASALAIAFRWYASDPDEALFVPAWVAIIFGIIGIALGVAGLVWSKSRNASEGAITKDRGEATALTARFRGDQTSFGAIVLGVVGVLMAIL